MSTLHVGRASLCITPETGTILEGHINRHRPSTDVMDDLHARILILKTEKASFLIISCDLLEFEKEFIDGLKDQIRNRYSVSPANCHIMATHTHTGPAVIKLGSILPDEGYLRRLSIQILLGIGEAFLRLEPAVLKAGRGAMDSVGINRRLMRNGEIIMAPNPEGPIDPELLVIGIYSPDGCPLGAIINCAVHPTTLGVDIYRISADFPGRIQRKLQETYGPSFLPLFLQGACGDVKPAVLDSRGNFKEGTEKDIDRIGKIIAGQVRALLDGEGFLLDNIAESGCADFLFPYASIPTVEELKEEIDRHKRKIGEINGAAGDVQDRHMNPLAMHREMMRWAKAMIERLTAGTIEKEMGSEIQILTIGGEVALIGIPGELFSEIGLKIKACSPYKYTMICGYSGGSLGYIPSESAMKEGGYEVSDAYKLYGHPGPFAADSERRLIERITAQLEERKAVMA